MTPAEIVLDASAVVRGFHRENRDASEIVDAALEGSSVAHAPDLVVPEVANALARLVRAGRSSPGDAAALLDVLVNSRIRIHPTTLLVGVALSVALDRGLSAYDGFYVALAEGLGVPLGTADRRLAGALEHVVLVDR